MNKLTKDEKRIIKLVSQEMKESINKLKRDFLKFSPKGPPKGLSKFVDDRI